MAPQGGMRFLIVSIYLQALSASRVRMSLSRVGGDGGVSSLQFASAPEAAQRSEPDAAHDGLARLSDAVREAPDSKGSTQLPTQEQTQQPRPTEAPRSSPEGESPRSPAAAGSAASPPPEAARAERTPRAKQAPVAADLGGESPQGKPRTQARPAQSQQQAPEPTQTPQLPKQQSQLAETRLASPPIAPSPTQTSAHSLQVDAAKGSAPESGERAAKPEQEPISSVSNERAIGSAEEDRQDVSPSKTGSRKQAAPRKSGATAGETSTGELAARSCGVLHELINKVASQVWSFIVGLADSGDAPGEAGDDAGKNRQPSNNRALLMFVGPLLIAGVLALFVAGGRTSRCSSWQSHFDGKQDSRLASRLGRHERPAHEEEERQRDRFHRRRSCMATGVEARGPPAEHKAPERGRFGVRAWVARWARGGGGADDDAPLGGQAEAWLS